MTMIWPNTTAEEMARQCYDTWMSHPKGKLIAKLEGENILKFYQIVQEWFEAMQNGTANDRFPDPTWKPKPFLLALTQEIADKIVSELDSDFMVEYSRFPEGLGSGPEFKRLAPHARVAFAQVVMDNLLTNHELLLIAETFSQEDADAVHMSSVVSSSAYGEYY